MRRTALGAVALGVGRAAIGGYGAAMGRDAWRATKRNAGKLLLLSLAAGMVVMPFIGGRALTRGYPRDRVAPKGTGVLLIAGGVVAGSALIGILKLWVPIDRGAVLTVLGTAAISGIVGMMYGLLEKPSRMAVFSISEHNEEFLEKLGFEELNGDEITHIDGDGNPLRLTEHNTDWIVFMAVGRRNQRAYIKLSAEGRMLGYTGVIPITEVRRYRDASGRFAAA